RGATPSPSSSSSSSGQSANKQVQAPASRWARATQPDRAMSEYPRNSGQEPDVRSPNDLRSVVSRAGPRQTGGGNQDSEGAMASDKRVQVGIDVSEGEDVSTARPVSDSPFVLLVLGDFGGGGRSGAAPVAFDRDDLDAAMARIGPVLRYS